MCLHLGEGGVSGRVYLSVVTAWYHLNKQPNPRKKRCTALDHCSGSTTSSGRPTAGGIDRQQWRSTAGGIDHQQWSTTAGCSGRPTAGRSTTSSGDPLLAVVDSLLEQWPTTVPVIGHCVQ
ncbi:hypothetical protein Adt_05559 [Abeliophyllum distichum]|uniref:Uncharacterized protein n=1 Tax=Abeliophyllum distichum TaxID=126358 RepID=A0ABD1V5P2_9LAMI